MSMQLNMPQGVTPISHDLYDLNTTVIVICAVIAAIVYGVLAYTIIRHRRSRHAVPATFDGFRKLEITWTIVPFLVLVGMAVPATQVLKDMDDFDPADLTIKITGHQWKWQYQYLEQNIGFFSHLSTPLDQIDGNAKKDRWYLLEVDKPLVLPVNKKVRFLVTSNDVIHSWWVSELGVKRDAIPGFIHEAWARIEKAGTYRGQCAELCGVNHGFMPIVVEAVSDTDFSAWVKTTRATLAAQRNAASSDADWSMGKALQRGQNLYERYCSACHKRDGTGLPPTFPSLVTSSVVVGTPMERHIDVVLQGVAGSAMQAFAPQLDDEELAAIITYERNAWGHATGDLITPAQIQAQRR
jgi:cytochrome c oxidase subunit II